jgi:ubiquinone/menaquinone biosynthesis C-methylase UbiE
VSKHITKEWDWSKNRDNRWLVPCTDSAYLVERWKGKDYKSLLDLGCGLGRHSIYMASQGFDVTAVDLSEYGINNLKEWAKKEKLDIKSCVSNMLSLPFEDNSFDCMIAYNVIYHTDTNGFIATLNEIKRVLKPEGELYITLISKNTYSYIYSKEEKRIDENTYMRDEDDTEKDVPHFMLITRIYKSFLLAGSLSSSLLK